MNEYITRTCVICLRGKESYYDFVGVRFHWLMLMQRISLYLSRPDPRESVIKIFIWSLWALSAQKPLIESLLCVLINRIKKSDSPVKLREKMLNFVVKYCKNCMFCRAQVIIHRKTSHISWRHSTFLESSRQRRWSSAISWRQNNGKMAERDRSHVIAVLQRLNNLSTFSYSSTNSSLIVHVFSPTSVSQSGPLKQIHDCIMTVHPKVYSLTFVVGQFLYLYSRAMKTQHPNVHQYLNEILNILSQSISGDFMNTKDRHYNYWL